MSKTPENRLQALVVAMNHLGVAMDALNNIEVLRLKEPVRQQVSQARATLRGVHSEWLEMLKKVT